MNQPITLRQLRYVVAVADTRHFGRAAAACHVSQPSLSAQVQALEEMLGGPLFERSKRRIILTPLGEAVVARARRILAETQDLLLAARDQAAPLAGDFRLGVIPTLGPYLLPRLMRMLRRNFPDLRLYLREDLTDRLVERLRRGELEAALLALPIEDPKLEALPVFDEPFLLAVPSGHRLARANRVTPGDLAGEHLLLLEDGHCLRDQALEVCRSAARTEEDAFGATSLSTLREMVAGRIGITLLPALACTAPTTADSDIALRPFDSPAPSRRIGLVWRRGAARRSEIEMLAEFLRRHLPEGAVAIPQDELPGEGGAGPERKAAG
ncbi:LysR substrate-binding domain-containing protein [Inquilinus limosus]|uniref:LysR substrate-binding domain-containing protein n=1 Tax=Inquilinus limosus TaxID=171674 RepID=UPI00040D3A6C|nr:LysR substrate-binding domain-containing protein [Inquilinus limosus]